VIDSSVAPVSLADDPHWLVGTPTRLARLTGRERRWQRGSRLIDEDTILDCGLQHRRF
jgi:hypothetical protein